MNRLVLIVVVLTLFGIHPQSHGQSKAPPRSVADILSILQSAGQHPQLVVSARAAASKQPPQAADDLTLARFFHTRARAHSQLGASQLERADLRRAAEHLEKGGGFLTAETKLLKARMLADLVSVEWDAGNFPEAVRLLEEVGELTSGRLGWELGTAANLARASARFGEIEKARRFIADAERIMRTLHAQPSSWFQMWEPRGQATLDRAKAEIALVLGEFSNAQQYFAASVRQMDRYLEGYRPGPDDGGVRQESLEMFRNYFEMRLATSLSLLGRHAEAELAARNALSRQLKTFGRDSVRTSPAIQTLAGVMLDQGRWEDASDLARAALDSASAGGASAQSIVVSNARALLGRTLTVQGRWKEAASVFQERARGLAQDADTLARFGAEDPHWAYALAVLGDVERAVEMSDTLLKRATSREGVVTGFMMATYDVARLRGFLAATLAAKGDREVARREFELAIPLLLQDRYVPRDQQATSVRDIELTWILEAYLRLLSEQLQGAAPASRRALVAAGFGLADAASGSSVQRALALASTRAAVRDDRLAELARREQDLANRITSLGDVLGRLLSTSPEKRPAKITDQMQRDIQDLRAGRAKLLKEIDDRFPEYADLVAPKPITLDQATDLLRPMEALVSIYVGAKETHVWAVSKGHEPQFATIPIGAGKLAESISRLRQSLDIGDASLANFPRFDAELAYELYSMLLKPIEGVLREAKSLIVVPRGQLGQIPFSLLVTEKPALAGKSLQFEEYRAVPWLIRKASIVQLPSLNSLAALRKYPRSQRGTIAFAGFGDPVFTKANNQTEATTARGLPWRNLNVGRIDSAGKRTLSNDLGNLARLADTADEIRSIGTLLDADPGRDIFLGEAANETNVKTRSLADRRIIVFATHGLVAGDLDGLMQPALALSHPEITGEKDADGLLTMDEILSLKLNANWVVLSACNTAASDGAGAEAVSGLGRAFFYAGARALLVSNWAVETVSARLLTTEIFRRQSADPSLPGADALREAMLNLMDLEAAADSSGKPLYAYAHPVFWAPFSLVGDGSAQ